MVELIFSLFIINLSTVYSSFLPAISGQLGTRAAELLGNDLSDYLLSSTNNKEERFLPEVGNGHMATQIKNECIFVNGLYNGHRTSSHRACVPSTLNWNIETKDQLIQRIFSLDSLIGLTKEIFIYSHYNISVTTYISRDFRQILIRNISLEECRKNDSVIVTTSRNNFNFSSADIDFEIGELGQIYILKGLTKKAENIYTTQLPVFVIFEKIPKTIVLNTSHPWTSFVTAIDDDYLRTFKAFNKAIGDRGNLLYRHAKAWIDTWDNGIIQITDSHKYLMQSVHAAQYYILSSLPFKDWSHTDPSWVFYGLSPGGLAHGEGENDYMGHVFWDMDIWIYPAFLPFHRESAIEMMKYRLTMLKSAIQHSVETGYRGARYPWESARTGYETSPSKTCSDREIHVTGDISYAVQQLLWIEARSSHVLYDKFEQSIIENVARFWESRIFENLRKDKVEILDVMPPDEYVHSCNNSAFTNIIARISLEAPIRLAKLYRRNISSEMLYWFNLAQNLSYYTDENRKLILEHDSYILGTIIKQADAMLLYYPLQTSIPGEYMENSQSYYEKVTDVNGPAMTWAIYSINWFKLKNIKKAENLFKNNFGYINEPFYVWSESLNGTGAINFHTGMGGYLQNILNGFMGMRLDLSGNGKIIFSPSISNIIYGINLHNLKFQGSDFNIKFHNEQMSLELTNDISLNVFATANRTNYILNTVNRKLVLAAQEVVITSPG